MDIYKNNLDNSERYALGKSGAKPLIFIGLNPSTATTEKSDPTIKRIQNYVSSQEYEGWVMLNLSPERSTYVEGLSKKLKKETFESNLIEIDSKIKEGSIICAVWGTSIETKPYLYDSLLKIIEIAKAKHCTWTCIKLTKYGHPCHPLYRRKGFSLVSEPLKLFDIVAYTQKLAI